MVFEKDKKNKNNYICKISYSDEAAIETINICIIDDKIMVSLTGSETTKKIKEMIQALNLAMNIIKGKKLHSETKISNLNNQKQQLLFNGN